jgi:hypothetical protein
MKRLTIKYPDGYEGWVQGQKRISNHLYQVSAIW